MKKNCGGKVVDRKVGWFKSPFQVDLGGFYVLSSGGAIKRTFRRTLVRDFFIELFLNVFWSFIFVEISVMQEILHETKSLATPQDHSATREDLLKEISAFKTDLTHHIYIVALFNSLAIVGSVVGIITFLLRK